MLATADIEQAVAVVEPEEKGVADGEEEEAKPELMNHYLMDRAAVDDRKWSRKSTSPRSVVDGGFTSAEPAASAGMSATDAPMIPTTTIQLVDEATQSCPSSVSGWYPNHLKRCQTSKTDSSCSLNVVSAGYGLPLDIARSALPLKGTFPSFEILPGGRLVCFQFFLSLLLHAHYHVVDILPSHSLRLAAPSSFQLCFYFRLISGFRGELPLTKNLNKKLFLLKKKWIGKQKDADG